MDTNSAPVTHLWTRPQIGVEEPLETSDRAERRHDLAGENSLEGLAPDAKIGRSAQRVDRHAAGSDLLAQAGREGLGVNGGDRGVTHELAHDPVAGPVVNDVRAGREVTLGSGHGFQGSELTDGPDLTYSESVLQDHLSPRPLLDSALAVTRAVDRYNPQTATCDPATWAQIADVTRQAVHLVELTKLETVWHWMATTTQYFAWCHRQGHPLEFTSDLVSAFCDTLTVVPSSVQTHRRRLTRMGEIAGTIEPAAKTEFPHHTETGQEPYTRSELDRWWEVATNQKTDHRARLLRATIALGAGAGLRTTDIANLRVTDVEEHPDHDGLLLVHLPDRVAPVDTTWVERVREVLADAPGDYVVNKHHEQTKDLLTYVKSRAKIPDDVPALTIRRLRTTYGVALLNRRLGPAEFMAVYGATTASVFERFARFVDSRWDDAEYLRVAAGVA